MDTSSTSWLSILLLLVVLLLLLLFLLLLLLLLLLLFPGRSLAGSSLGEQLRWCWGQGRAAGVYPWSQCATMHRRGGVVRRCRAAGSSLGEQPGGSSLGEQPGGEQPGGEQPGVEQPGGEQPGVEQPGGSSLG